MPERRFDGRVAVVTGAGQGIGRAVAERFATDGAAVAVADRNAETAAEVVGSIESSGGRAIAIPTDVTDPADAERLLRDHHEALRPDRRPGEQCRDPALHPGRRGLARGVAPRDRRQPDRGRSCAPRRPTRCCATPGHGRIVNLASMAGRATSTLGGVHYTTAKAGVLGLTRHLAREWARDGITVNAISPGIVDTPMVRASTDEARMAHGPGLDPVRAAGRALRDRRRSSASSPPTRRRTSPAPMSTSTAAS